MCVKSACEMSFYDFKNCGRARRRPQKVEWCSRSHGDPWLKLKSIARRLGEMNWNGPRKETLNETTRNLYFCFFLELGFRSAVGGEEDETFSSSSSLSLPLSLSHPTAEVFFLTHTLTHTQVIHKEFARERERDRRENTGVCASLCAHVIIYNRREREREKADTRV